MSSRFCSCILKPYYRRMEMGRLMSRIMIARLTEPVRALGDRVAWIVPVPLHWRRRMWRGFNQSLELAEDLSASVEIPVRADTLVRRRYTKRQVDVPREARAKNVEGAFEVGPAYRNRDLPGILLVDDVVTTGETLYECARTLAAAGAPQIWAAAFARGGITLTEPEAQPYAEHFT